MGDVEAMRREMLLGCGGVSYVLHHGFASKPGLGGMGRKGEEITVIFEQFPTYRKSSQL